MSVECQLNFVWDIFPANVLQLIGNESELALGIPQVKDSFVGDSLSIMNTYLLFLENVVGG